MESDEQLRAEIQYIFDSGANEVRVFEMAKGLLSRRTHHPMKPLTDLAQHPEDCRAVWECVTGEKSTQKLECFRDFGNDEWDNDEDTPVVIQEKEYSVLIWQDGWTRRTCGRQYNPFALVALLTKLGYAPTEA